jgi:hypothetical protein
MKKKNNILLLYLFLLPFATYAHGEDVLTLMWSELFLIIAFIVTLLILKINLKGKGILIFIFLLTHLVIYKFTEKIPYTENKILINLVTIGLPILTFLITYLIIGKKYEKIN